eukprot:Gb_17510 [translate_table: standard]
MVSSSASDSSQHEDEATHLQPCFVLRRASPETVSSSKGLDSSKSKRKIEFAVGVKGNTADSTNKSLHSLPPFSKDEHALYGKWRMEAFTFVWSRIENIIKDVLLELNTHTFEEIQRWICDSFFAAQQSKLYRSLEAKNSNASPCSPVVKQLATALVFIRNVEFVDDQRTFKDLGTYLKSHNCHVANLKPQDFSLKAGIGGCVRSLLKQTVLISPDTPDIEILASWYHEPTHREYPVVIIIEDVERCNCSLLAEFIIMLSEWVVQIPLVLVMGMATTVDSLRKLLPSSAIQHLRLQRFNLKYPLERLEAVVSALLIESFCGFDIGHKVAKFLYNFFLKQDGTVTSFVRALKIACMEHFCVEPLSFLCKELTQDGSQEGWENMCKALPGILLQYAANLPSVKGEGEDEYKDEQVGMKLAAALLDMKKKRRNWSTVLQCLCEVGKHTKIHLIDIFCDALFPLASLDQQMENGGSCSRHMLRNGDLLNNMFFDLCKGKFINLAIRKIRDLSLPSVASLLKEWAMLTKELTEINYEICMLQSIVNPDLNVEDVEGNSFGNRGNYELLRGRLLSNIEDGLHNCSDSVTTISHDFNGDLLSMPQTSKTSGERNFQKVSSHNYSTAPKGDPKAANEMAMKLLERMVKEYLIPMEAMPFHEILCFKHVSALQQALMGDTRKTIQNDLLNSQSYLQCRCCKGLTGLSSSMHDTSIAYNLAQEHGDVINVHDWYQSFEAIVSKSDVENPCVEKREHSQKKLKITNGSPQIDKDYIQARFSKAIAELQIVGLLRMPSKRRPDYVQRVAFGV